MNEDILAELKHAFHANDVVIKNIALKKACTEIELLRKDIKTVQNAAKTLQDCHSKELKVIRESNPQYKELQEEIKSLQDRDAIMTEEIDKLQHDKTWLQIQNSATSSLLLSVQQDCITEKNRADVYEHRLKEIKRTMENVLDVGTAKYLVNAILDGKLDKKVKDESSIC